MKKVHLATICCLYFFSGTAQTSYNLSTGINQDNLEKVREEAETRKKDLNENFNIPEYHPPKQLKPLSVKSKSLPKEDLTIAQTKQLSIDKALDSKNSVVVQDALNRMKEKAQENPMSKGVGLDNMVKYQEGQEEFNGGYYGFNPYKSVEENKKFYSSMGFNLSYKYSDARIYSFIFGGLAFLAIMAGGFYFWNKRIRWKEL